MQGFFAFVGSSCQPLPNICHLYHLVSIMRMSGIGDLNSLVHVKTLYLNNSINHGVPPDPRFWTRMTHLTNSMLGNVGSSGWLRKTRVQSLLVQG